MNESEKNGIEPRSVSRRGFLAGAAGAAGAAVALGTLGGSAGAFASTIPKGLVSPRSSSAGDAKVAALAASLEVLAVNTYTSGLAAAHANKLGTVPAAVANFATMALANHQAALKEWNSVLTSAGAKAVHLPPASLKATVDTAFAKVTNVSGLAKLALLLEQTASDTYLSAIPTLKSKAAITLAGQLQVVDQEHAAILHFVLGEYPVPDVFQNTTLAFHG